ncbi:hypothetical protein [Novosphingobium sp. Chol11]|uniref:hypothetical protein n=1 Tax=Novosphingobium sp. Chol11 TaxID=1385763 RepID=UPI0025DC14FE|nr:hypothetical protein [Novosphingobium sp. Chol11]
MTEVTKVGSEVTVNSGTGTNLGGQQITALSGGGFVVTWHVFTDLVGENFSAGIFAQMFDASGAEVGGLLHINTETTNDQLQPAVTGLDGGGFVVTWYDQSQLLGDSSGGAIAAQIFDNTGTAVGGDFLINTQTDNNQLDAKVTALDGGGFVVTWQDLSGTLGDSDAGSIKAQVYNNTGTALGSEFLVNTQTAGEQAKPTITGLADGRFVVTWRDASGTLGDSTGTSIKAQVFMADGSPSGSEFLVNTSTAGAQGAPVITKLGDGGFVIAWHDVGDGAVRAQRYDFTGATLSSEFSVGASTEGFNSQPAISSLEDGGFVITWAATDTNGFTDTFAQVFDAAGLAIGSAILVPTQTLSSQDDASVTALTNGGFAVTWLDVSDTNVKAQVFAVNHDPVISSDGGGATGSVSVAENTAAVTTVVAADPDAGTVLEYAITGGADAALFDIDAVTGALAFVAAPDFEDPTDADSDNVYDVIVTASDGTLTDTQTLAITVTDAAENPVISSDGGAATGAVSVAENTAAVTTVLAADPDAGTVLEYAITGGADAALFEIDAVTGALAFVAAPDFEDPTDADSDKEVA